MAKGAHAIDNKSYFCEFYTKISEFSDLCNKYREVIQAALTFAIEPGKYLK
ncbi:hypothetical protein ACE1CI_00430 [Aerosakkonemataceae cyanobacterium BLCC-F50]|uniref:Uncharacterized protein n=1 Tax=Floridaenema flaviceps BLCC-F50 TaxID=3153642 RepID=A0ABV4XI92_9CYAN